MKKMITTVAVLALSATMALAANGDGKGFGHGRKFGFYGPRLAAKLNLTDAQKDQWKSMSRGFRQDNKALFDSVRQNRQDLRAAKQAGDEAKVTELKSALQSQRAQLKQLFEAQQEKFVSILTPEQKAQFEAFKAERQARRAEREQQHQQ